MTLDEDLVQEAKTLIAEATKKGVILRVLGGVAIRFHCPSAGRPPLVRRIADIDLFGLSKQVREIKEVFTSSSYVPAQMFNALHGNKRLMFFQPENQVRRDVFLDFFEMCHKFDFRRRLEVDDFSLPVSDLLMTKLQIVEIEERDWKDIACIVLDHELANSDSADKINKDYIADICSKDWGIYRTFTQNLEKIQPYVQEIGLEDSRKEVARARVKALAEAIEQAPKSMKWKTRSMIGDKMSWYDLPEAPKPIKFE